MIKFTGPASDGLLDRSLLRSNEVVHSFSDTVYALLKGAVRKATHLEEYKDNKDKEFYYTTLKTAPLFATSTFLGPYALTHPGSRRKR